MDLKFINQFTDYHYVLFQNVMKQYLTVCDIAVIALAMIGTTFRLCGGLTNESL